MVIPRSKGSKGPKGVVGPPMHSWALSGGGSHQLSGWISWNLKVGFKKPKSIWDVIFSATFFP